jgi:hypothetical protein
VKHGVLFFGIEWVEPLNEGKTCLTRVTPLEVNGTTLERLVPFQVYISTETPWIRVISCDVEHVYSVDESSSTVAAIWVSNE